MVLLYWRFFWGLLGLGPAVDSAAAGFRGWAGLLKIGAAGAPICIAGALCGSKIKAQLFHPAPVAWALIVGGVALIAAEGLRRRAAVSRLDALSLRQCLLVGLFQCLALWPGMSRSAATIVGAMLLGCERRLAAEFSFLVAVPVLGAAVAYDLLKNLALLSAADIPFFLTGLLVAFVTALAAIKLFLGIVSRYSMRLFGYYRIVLGLLVLWLMRVTGAGPK